MEIRGIDVSKYQGDIDFAKVKASGINFVIIRAGYGTSLDTKFLQNIRNAIANNLRIGIYWFIYATNTTSVLNNADVCAKAILPYKEHINMKVWSDWEYDSDDRSIKNGVVQNKKTRTNLVRTFNERLKSYGFEVGVYSNEDYIKNKFEDLSVYPLWYAKYSSTKKRDCLMWQYSSNGSVPGIKVDVDMNIYYDTAVPIIPQKPNNNLVIQAMNIIKGDTAQFSQIIKNIKTALNVDYGLNFLIDDVIDGILLTNLHNVQLSTVSYKPNITYTLQQLLAWWGFTITVDGVYGNGCKNTVQIFQKLLNISQTGTTTNEFWLKVLGL